MKKVLLFTLAPLALAACTQPQPLCDRDAVTWDKYDTVELPEECAPPEQSVEQDFFEDSSDDVTYPDDEQDDDTSSDNDDAPDYEPVGKDKSDNSDANGKGGNKHDREDKTDNGTEVAEDKKGV